MNEILDFFRNLFGLGSPPKPEPAPADPCQAPACVDARNRLVAAREGFNSVCNGLRSLNVIRRIANQIFSTPIWIIIALVVIAALVGGLLAVVLWALVGLYLFSWVVLWVVAKMQAALALELDKRRIEFTNSLPDVMAQCPANCRGDLSVPECQPE